MEKIARGRGREANIALGKCTRGSALTGLLYWLVYSNKLRRRFLGPLNGR